MIMAIQNCLYLILTILCVCDSVRAQMEGFIVGGDFASIYKYPHSAFLAIAVNRDNLGAYSICGSSILNQQFILTAGHCLERCSRLSYISVMVGNENPDKGTKSSANKFKIHEKYNSRTLTNDIAIVSLKSPLQLNQKVKRVSILSNPPYKGETAYVAGWGLTDEINRIRTTHLKSVRQDLWSRNECMQILGNLPEGCICAGLEYADRDYAAPGDSGSALVVRDYIQVGIVSFKLPQYSKSLVVYTEVKHFYDWIRINTYRMFCTKKKHLSV